ncbi:MAG: efflux RND transporter periplasmic adaptor subunit [Acidobacteriota bacterium]|nr:efflux RND transporter periplasmic adaptor subunit [Acidobacteriota bacterium]
MSRFTYTVTFVAALAGTSLLAGCGHKEIKKAVPETVSGLSVAKIMQQTVPLGSTVVGTVHAQESAVLSAQTMGHVRAVLVHEGDFVKAGQTLIRLDDAQSQAQVAQAQAGLAGSRHAVQLAESNAELADSTLKRYEMLRASKSVSPQEFDEVSRRAQAAHAQLDAVKAQLAAAQAGETSSQTVAGYSVIKAPFAGRVTSRMVDPGALAAPGVPLLQIDSEGPLELDVSADESLLPALRPGMKVKVQINSAPQAPDAGTVKTIVPAADPGSHTFLVKIALPPSKDLRPGMYGTALIATGIQPAVLVPQAAIVVHGSLKNVWVVDPSGIATLRYITVGSMQGDSYEALSGISAGETVVLNPGDRELGGKRIEGAQ